MSFLPELIESYLSSVETAIQLLSESGIARPQSNLAWAISNIPNIGKLNSGGSYRKHGYGCEVELSDGLVDFDFGENGETNFFDSWRLWAYANARPNVFRRITQNDIELELDKATSNGMLVRKAERGLYYVANGT